MGEPEERIDQRACAIVGEPMLVGRAGDDEKAEVDGVGGPKGRAVRRATAGGTCVRG